MVFLKNPHSSWKKTQNCTFLKILEYSSTLHVYTLTDFVIYFHFALQYLDDLFIESRIDAGSDAWKYKVVYNLFIKFLF